MSTLFVNNLNTASGSTITIPTGKQLIGTDTNSIKAPGMIVQVVQHQNSTESNTAGTTFIDTGSTITFTPKYSNSLLIFQCMMCAEQYAAANTGSRYRLLRDSTVIYESDYDLYNSAQNSSNQHISKVNYLFQETSSSTSARTYKWQYSSVTSGGTSRHNKYGSPSMMMIMEVAQ